MLVAAILTAIGRPLGLTGHCGAMRLQRKFCWRRARNPDPAGNGLYGHCKRKKQRANR